MNEDGIADSEITLDEVTGMIRRLKKGKASGQDGILTEHIYYGGDNLKVWLCRVFNYVLVEESIPECFKSGIIVPVHKGKGRNPQITGSYRGITLSSTIAKLFEYILLERLKPILHDSGHPLLYQTAYQKNISCEEAIFSTQEAIRILLKQNGHAFLALYDLEKAFDSIEIPILLNCLFHAGVNGAGWRLIRSWYENSSARVKIQNTLSEPLRVERGVRQGSVLSPTLFLIVMDELLNSIEETL